MNKQKIGLCIGGGGAYGISSAPIISHILTKTEISYISGCSIGALVGAYLAKFGEVESLYEKIKNNSKLDWAKLVDLNNPIKSMIKGNKIKKFLEEIFKDSLIEELNIPLIIIASNITSKKPTYFSKGLVVDAIMASISIPGIFKHYEINNELYADGMLFENLPISCLKDKELDKIIGIDFFLNEVNSNEIPKNLIETLVLSFSLMVTLNSKSFEHNSKYFIFSPKKEGSFGMLEFFNSKNIYKLGEEELENKKETFNEWISN